MRFSLTALLAGIVALAACDNPVTSDDHAEPEKVVVIGAQGEIASATETEATGNITVSPSGSSGPLVIQYLDEHDEPIELDEDLYLEARVANEAIAEFVPTTPGTFTGTIEAGPNTGVTSVEFVLMHGVVGSGHADFTPAPIEIRVE